MMRKNMFIALPMKYCCISVTEPLKITDLNCKLIKDIKTYGKCKNSYYLINNLLFDHIVLMKGYTNDKRSELWLNSISY
jgi:hypothetical protein